MSASNPGPGRPPGISEATLERQRRVRAMHAKGISIATIAELEDRVPAYIRMLINDGGAKEDGYPESVAAIEPPKPRRLSRRTAQYRAWEIVQQRPTTTLGLDVNAFWIRLIVEIHEHGDGFRLGIGQPESRFPTRADLEVLFARPDHLDIDDWLQRLFSRGRLIDIDGVDIGIPHGMKLTAAENIRVKPAAKHAGQPPQDGQMSMLHAVPGGLSDANKTPPQTQIKSELNLRSAAIEFADDANSIPIKFASVAGARAATAAANAKDNQSLSSSSSNGSHAGANGIKFAPDANLIPPGMGADANEINLQRSPLAELTAELATLAELDRAANAEDLGWVEAWAQQGFSADALRAVVEIKRGQMNGKRVAGLGYFDGAMQDARRIRDKGRPQGAPPAAPVAAAKVEEEPEEPEEPIVGTGPEADWARVRRLLGKGVVRSWFGKAVLVGVEDGEVTISMPTTFIRNHVVKDYGSVVSTLWTQLNPDVRRVEFVVAATEQRTG